MTDDAPRYYEDIAGNGVTVVTVLDPATERWTTTVVGGPLDLWSRTYRDEDDPVVQHAKAIEIAREAGAAHASDSDVGSAAVGDGDQSAR